MVRTWVQIDTSQWVPYDNAIFQVDEGVLLILREDADKNDITARDTLSAYPKGTWLHAKLEA